MKGTKMVCGVLCWVCIKCDANTPMHVDQCWRDGCNIHKRYGPIDLNTGRILKFTQS